MARTMLIMDWAKDEFPEPIPCKATIYSYAKNGFIIPAPKKAGRSWIVEPTARFVGETGKPVIKSDDDPRLKRILKDGTSP